MAQQSHWDDVTARLIDGRLHVSSELRFFTPREARTVDRLAAQIVGDPAPVPVAALVDHRLAAGETDGWRHHDLPEDAEAWRRSLAWLDADARDVAGAAFADLAPADASAIVDVVQHAGGNAWHAATGGHVWSLWTRYVCAAFYSHPYAWDEIGFPGPAYPRGYGNLGLDRREPWERRR
jgi:hypothetical protein